MTALNIDRAPVVEQVANDIIERFHPDLKDVRILYIFNTKPKLRGGKITLGSARKATPTERLFLNVEAVITICSESWDRQNSRQRQALLDHELHHLRVEVDGTLSLNPHDVEEFSTVLKRWGTWKSDLAMMFEQLELGIDADIPGEVIPFRLLAPEENGE